jgi:DNA repair exonuclease SbcCD ATPase subunit
MSEETNFAQGDTAPANGDDVVDGNLNGEQMPQDNQLAYETYKKALSQRHKFKEENAALKAQLESVKQSELEAEGKLKEKADYWKTKAVELEEKYSKTQAQYGWNQVKAQLSSELTKAGCVDSDVAISLLDKAELNSVEVNDDFTVSKQDLNRIVDNLKKDQRTQKIRLFGPPVGVNDMVPGTKTKFEEPPKDLSKLSHDELAEMLKN